jgi:hypothetical protein
MWQQGVAEAESLRESAEKNDAEDLGKHFDGC